MRILWQYGDSERSSPWPEDEAGETRKAKLRSLNYPISNMRNHKRILMWEVT